MNEHLNLIPRVALVRRRIRASLRFWAVAFVVTAVGLAAMSFNSKRVLDLTRRRLDSLEREFAPVRNLQAQLIQYQNRLQEIDTIRAQTFDIEQRRPLITLMAALSHAARDAGGNVTISKLDLQSQMSPDVMSVNPRYGLHIQGAGMDNSSVATFAHSLEQSGLFTSVDLHATSNMKMNGLDVRQFDLECTF